MIAVITEKLYRILIVLNMKNLAMFKPKKLTKKIFFNKIHVNIKLQAKNFSD